MIVQGSEGEAYSAMRPPRDMRLPSGIAKPGIHDCWFRIPVVLETVSVPR